jgi:hypothetical protein
MATTILFDELHIALRVPCNLTAPECRAIARALRRPGFLPALTRAVREVLRRYPSLRKVRISVTR